MVTAGILAGGVGAVCRYLAGGLVQRRVGSRFPAGTMAVNLAGAFAAGLVAGAAGPETALRIVGLGFLGGFTTFSTWAVETLTMGRQRHTRTAVLTMAAMLIGGIALCAIGFGLTD